jgi:hypothetical protein
MDPSAASIFRLEGLMREILVELRYLYGGAMAALWRPCYSASLDTLMPCPASEQGHAGRARRPQGDTGDHPIGRPHARYHARRWLKKGGLKRCFSSL